MKAKNFIKATGKAAACVGIGIIFGTVDYALSVGRSIANTTNVIFDCVCDCYKEAHEAEETEAAFEEARYQTVGLEDEAF